MRIPTLIGVAIAGLIAVSPVSAQSVTHMTGTVMCGELHHPSRYSAVCSEKTRYVLVTSDHHVAYTIKHQGFSGLRQLVGSQVNVIGEVTAHDVDILQIAAIPSNCLDR